MRARHIVRHWPLLVVLAVGSSCIGADPTFVAAARATYDAIAPEYRAYVDADPQLTDEQRAIRRATLDRWNEAIATREVRR
jgi:hypothetical protein